MFRREICVKKGCCARVAESEEGGAGGRRTRAKLEQRPHRGELPRSVGVGITGRPVGVDLQDGDLQRGLPTLVREARVCAAVSQQPDDIKVVVLRRREQRRIAVRVRVVHGSLGRALEYHPHDLHVPESGRRYERRTLDVVGALEA